jgi:hypothetical protein
MKVAVAVVLVVSVIVLHLKILVEAHPQNLIKQ